MKVIEHINVARGCAHALAREVSRAHDRASAMDHARLSHAFRLACDLTHDLDVACETHDLDFAIDRRGRARAHALDLELALDRAHLNLADFASTFARANNLAIDRLGHALHLARAEENPDLRSKPPECAESVLLWLAPIGSSEEVLGDFLERHQRKFRGPLTKRRLLLARLDYWMEVLRSVPGFLRIRIMGIRLAERVRIMRIQLARTVTRKKTTIQ